MNQACNLLSLETTFKVPLSLELIAGAQSNRLNEQRAPWAVLPGITRAKQPEILQRLSVAATDKDSLPDDSFFEQLMKMQGTRIEDQRSSLPGEETVSAPTIPDEDFFSLICKIQVSLKLIFLLSHLLEISIIRIFR